jgi:hypothetical protein
MSWRKSSALDGLVEKRREKGLEKGRKNFKNAIDKYIRLWYNNKAVAKSGGEKRSERSFGH